MVDKRHWGIGVLLIGWLIVGASWGWSQPIPNLPELTNDPWDFDSPLWERGAMIGDFKVPDAHGGDPAPAGQKTEVRLAHDGQFLYVRFTAFDDAIDQAVAAPLDEFADDFPQGDHGEIWVTSFGSMVFAFDCNGNKYDAHNYDSRFYSGFRVKSRRMENGWQSIVVIPLSKPLRGQPSAGKSLHLAFVRHLDHGADEPERSTAGGKIPMQRTAHALE